MTPLKNLDLVCFYYHSSFGILLKVGDFLYCHGRGKTNCCFHNEVCNSSMTEANEMMLNKSMTFLKDTKSYLSNLVDNLGYDTCHPITGYDASPCEKDCRTLEKSDFAKNCTENDGLFKCCIRWLIWYFYFYIF